MAPTTYTPPINTYVPLESIVLTNAASSVTFFNIAQSDANGTYKDLVLVSNTIGTGTNMYVRFNGDSSTSNYSYVFMRGRTSGYDSAAYTTDGAFYSIPCSTGYAGQLQVMDFTDTSKHKTALMRDSNASADYVIALAGRWASTAAVSAITMYNNNGSWSAGSTFSLYAVHG